MNHKIVRIVECFHITGLGILTELQHTFEGIPPNTEIINPTNNETWIIKKRVLHGILILDNSEKYFKCETESIHFDSFFENHLERKKAIDKELKKRENGIYTYLIQPKKKKQRIKPDAGTEMKVK